MGDFESIPNSGELKRTASTKQHLVKSPKLAHDAFDASFNTKHLDTSFILGKLNESGQTLDSLQKDSIHKQVKSLMASGMNLQDA